MNTVYNIILHAFNPSGVLHKILKIRHSRESGNLLELAALSGFPLSRE